MASCAYARGDVQLLGFEVRESPDPSDPIVGPAHIDLTPPSLDESGQIPLRLRLALCAVSEWIIDCDR